MNSESRWLRLSLLFAAILSVFLPISHRALADVRIQFVPSSGTAPLQGGSSYKLPFAGTVAAVTGTFSGVDASVASSGTLSISMTGGTSSGTNTQAQFTQTRSAVTVSGSGAFTEGPLYQSYGGFNVSGANALWLSLSGLKAFTWFQVELYAYDNSSNGGTSFTDLTAGSAATSGSIAYAAGAAFTTNSDADNRFSVILAVLSDTTGKILIKGSGLNGGNSYAIVNGLRISSKCIPKVYTPTLNPAEKVVATVTPQQFGAKGDGVTDDTTAFQNAINFVYHTGTRAGGVVYVPNATYAFYGNLSLPAGVTLHGDWTNWTSGTTGAVGATFAIYTTGSATGTAFLTVAGNDAVVGLNFWYPNQDPSNITPYPYTFQVSSACALQDVVLINSYLGMNIHGNEYSPRGVYGSPLAQGIQVDGGADWASMADINFTPAIWAASKLPNAPAANGPQATWMLNNGTGIVLMRIDGINCIQINISGYNVGVNMSQSSGPGTTGVSMPSIYSGTIQNCNTGVVANYMPSQQGLQMTNFTISAGTAIAHTAVTGFFIQLENCLLTGTSGTSVLIDANGSGDWNDFFQAQDCTFNGTIVQNSGVGDLVDCTLNSGTQCVLGSNVCKTAFAGCSFSPSQKIVNNAAASALILSSSGATLAPSPVLSPGVAWNAIFAAFQACQPSRPDLFVSTDYGAAGDGNSDDTAAIQAALAAAAGNGGGIVYLPGGHYKISSSLTVPGGVELRGANELRHAAGSWADGYCKASVLQPTAATSGSGGPPAVILSASSGLRGVDFSYESQTPVAPVAYPPSIQGRGANVYVIASALPNTCIGIDFDTYSCPNHYITLVYGVPLNTFIKLGNGSSGYVVDTEAQSTFWVYLDDSNCTPNYRNGALDSAIGTWTLANSTVHWWGNCNETVAINPSINDNIAVDCASENGRGPTVVGVVQTNDVSNYGFYLEGSGTSNVSLANSWIVTRTTPIYSTSSYQGVFRLFNVAVIAGGDAIDYSIAGGDVGIQLAYTQIYGPLGAQVTGGVFNLINECTYLTYQAGSNDFPAYPVNFNASGVAGNPSRVVGSFSRNGFAITSYPGSVTNAWGNFAEYTKPAIPAMPGGAALVATGSVGAAFSYLIPASESPTSYYASGLPTGLNVNTVTGMISGIPAVASTNSVILTASNAAGSGTAGMTISIVPPPPSITSGLSATGMQWNGFSYQIAGTNAPYLFTANGLPSGLSVDPATGIISGIPTVAGTASVQITAANDGGTSPAATLNLVTLPAPLSITSALSATGTDRSAFNYQITANNGPIGYGAAGLPAGLSVDPGMGAISGVPTMTGTSSVTISAFNASGTGSAILAVIVAPAAPLISSTLSVTGTNGAAFSYRIVGTDNPTGYSASGLPTGLSFSASTGLISGTPTVTGTKTATIIASNAAGSGSAGLVVGILPPAPPLPTGMTGVSGSAQITLAWNASTGAVSYNVKRSLTAGSGFVTVANITGTACVDTTVANGTLYYYVVTALGSSGVESANSNSVGIMPGTLPGPWQWQDIAASNIGGANCSGSTFSVEACGSDIWSTSDSFGFVFQTGGTACRIIARVVAMDNTASNAKAGVMIRETLAANSTFVDVVLDEPTSVQSISRNTTGASCVDNLNSGSFTAPYWVKLVRSGTVFTSYISSNGSSWTRQATVAVAMASSMYVGMPVCSHNTGAICGATFDNVSVSGTVPPAPQLSNYQSPAVLRFGDNLSYQILGSNSPTFYTASGLPSGLNYNATTGLITGSPAALGTSIVAIGAGNDGGMDNENLTIVVVAQSQVITSAPGITGTSGRAFNYQITANNSPTSYAASGLPDGLGVNSSTGLISGTPTPVGTFSASISAINLTGSGSSALIITILPPPPPVITSATAATGTNGSAFNYQIAASNNPTSYAASGLPDGLSLNSSTGLISGTPTPVGTFNASISAINAGGTGTASFAIDILPPPPPVITSASAATGTNGNAFSYQITASSNPTSYAASGLSDGLSVDPGTGLISGTPAVTATFNAIVSAINLGGTGSASVRIAIVPPPPVITSATAATGTNASGFSYQITATNNPTGYGASGLPAGLAVNPGTGSITGTPAISGTFNASVSASNDGGAGVALLRIAFVVLPGTANRWTWDPLAMGNGSDGGGTWDNVTAIFSSGTTDVVYGPGVATKSVGTTAVGSNTIAVTSTTGLLLGEALSLSNFAAGTVVTTVSGTTVSLSSTAGSAVSNSTSFSFVDANDVGFGNGTDSAGTVTVSGTQYAGSMTIEPAGSGNYTFSNGTIVLGSRYGSTGILTLNDSATIGSALNLKGITFATAGATLTLNGVSSDLANGNTVIGGTSAAVSLASSLLLSSGTCTTGFVMMWNIGDMTSGTAGLAILPGATLNQTNNVFIGYFSNNPGFVKLNGGTWNTSSGASIVLGRTYAGGMNVQSGALNALGVITVGMNTTGLLNLNGGILTSNTTLALNSGNGNGTVNMTGGTASFLAVNLGGGGYGNTSTSGTGVLNVTGGSLYVGSGGIVKSGSGTSVCAVNLSGGTLAASASWSSSLPLNLTNMITFQAADGTNTGRNITLSGNLSGTGGLTKTGSGTLTLSGSNNYTGGTTVNSGTLIVNNGLAVAGGATLSGLGAVGGAVTVNGQISPGVNGSGTLTIDGDLAVGANGALQYGVGTAGGMVKVNGNLTLDGTLNAFDSGGLTSGTYRLIAYTGALTDNGLAIGSMPPYGLNYKVDTSIAGQVNLIVSPQMPMDAWKASVFGSGVTIQAVSGDAVANNSCGVSNLMAYALGVNPFAFEAWDLPVSSLKPSNGNRYLSLQFYRNTAATDISCIVEAGNSPAVSGSWTAISTLTNGVWSPPGNVSESGSGAQVNVVVSDTTSTATVPVRFMRLKVIH